MIIRLLFEKINQNFISIIKFISVLLVFIFFAASPELSAQVLSEYRLNDIIVTASRTPTSFSDLTRNVIIIGPEEIKDAPVNSVQGLLQYAAGVDLQQRGVDGVQGDVSIRGGSFEETLIMIDGVSVNDPQTGHHNLNLPVTLDDIQRIEILKGPGSSVYGANAFSGIINIITKKSSAKSLSLETSGGQNGYYDGLIHASLPVGILNNHISLSKQKSDGYMHNTEFDITDFTYGSSISSGSSNVNLLFGYNDKKFGANSYYSVLFPNQWEHTTTKLLNLNGSFGSESFLVLPKVYWRHNDDNYILDYTNPAFYENNHHTDVYGAEVQASIVSNIGITSFGGEYNTDKIVSNNLGNHSRVKKGIFAEQKISPLDDFTVIADAYAYDYSDIGWKLWPGINLGYNVAKDVRLYGSIGEAFRIPTYTELYYSSPASVGNPNLQTEETVDYEIGLNTLHPEYNARASIFYKQGKNLIDWVRASSTQPWTARNITKINTAGVELNLEVDPSALIKNFPIYKASLDYTYLNSSQVADEFQSQYLLQYLRHQLIVNVENNWWAGIRQSWELRYESRVNAADNFLVDTQLSRSFNQWKIFVKATNLFDKSYYEVSGVPLPGRWITAGIKLNIGE
ncbi:MAG: TonB-dependent receptor [Bacteroidetes bacterium]|nr:TonB-dependent receptor [Bacteroidota bacterium]